MAKIKHGMAGTRLYNIWVRMKQRCGNPNCDDYKYYGGRGITYDPTFETFEGFLAGMPDGYNERMEIDRINTNGNYVPGNMRWATRVHQMRNTRRTLVAKRDNGELVSYAQLGEETGLSRGTISKRIYRGETLEQAMRPARTPAKPVAAEKVKAIKQDLWSMSREDVAAWHNVSISTVNDIYYQRRHNHVEID